MLLNTWDFWRSGTQIAMMKLHMGNFVKEYVYFQPWIQYLYNMIEMWKSHGSMFGNHLSHTMHFFFLLWYVSFINLASYLHILKEYF